MKKYLIPVFLAAVFSVLSFLASSNLDLPVYLHATAFLAIATAVYFLIGKYETVYFALFTQILFVLTHFIPAFYVVDTHIAMFFLAAHLIFEKDLKATLKRIGFPGNLRTTVIYTLGGLFLVFAATFLLTFLLQSLGYDDSGKIAQKALEFPAYILVFAVVAAPFSEELFFRAFLAGRFGIWISSLLFALSHFAYWSAVEFLGAFVIGLVFALVFVRSRSITPCIFMHLVYNLVSVLVMTGAAG